MSETKHPRPSRYELTQTQWKRIEDLLPGKARDPGRTAADNRSFVNGVLWVLRSGACWSDLPTRYGAYKSVPSASPAGRPRASGSGCCSPGFRIEATSI